MTDQGKEDLIARADELNIRLADTALVGSEPFLDRDYWRQDCDTTAEFHVAFYDHVERCLSVMVARGAEARPSMLDFLASTDLEEGFAPMQGKAVGYASITCEIKYLLARSLLPLLDGRAPDPDLFTRIQAAFGVLWSLPGKPVTVMVERFRAFELLLHVTYGEYQQCVGLYESKSGFPLTKYENAARTLAKECYLLAQIAAGSTDQDLRFGAATFMALLQLNYYQWLTNDDPAAEVQLAVLTLAFYVNAKITGTHQDFFASMAPREVFRRLESLQSA